MVIHPKSVAVFHFISSGTGPRGSYWTSTSEHHIDTSLLCRQRDQSLFDNLPRKRTPTLAARLHLRIARYSFERSTIQSRVTARFPRLKKSSRVSSYATTPYAYASAPAWGIRRVEWTFVEDGQSPGVLIRYSFFFLFWVVSHILRYCRSVEMDGIGSAFSLTTAPCPGRQRPSILQTGKKWQ